MLKQLEFKTTTKQPMKIKHSPLHVRLLEGQQKYRLKSSTKETMLDVIPTNRPS